MSKNRTAAKVKAMGLRSMNGIHSLFGDAVPSGGKEGFGTLVTCGSIFGLTRVKELSCRGLIASRCSLVTSSGAEWLSSAPVKDAPSWRGYSLAGFSSSCLSLDGADGHLSSFAVVCVLLIRGTFSTLILNPVSSILLNPFKPLLQL